MKINHDRMPCAGCMTHCCACKNHAYIGERRQKSCKKALRKCPKNQGKISLLYKLMPKTFQKNGG